MTWRRAHGAAAELGRMVVLESPPSDELPSASGSDPARSDRDALGRFRPGNRLARSAKHRAGPTGILAKLEAKADPDWQAANRWSRRYAQHRCRELAQLHGGELSAGVCGIVTTAAQLMADARYLRARGAADGDASLLRTAAQLTTAARQAERDAWELASREAAARETSGPSAIDRLRRRHETARTVETPPPEEVEPS